MKADGTLDLDAMKTYAAETSANKESTQKVIDLCKDISKYMTLVIFLSFLEIINDIITRLDLNIHALYFFQLGKMIVKEVETGLNA